jgi:capsular exopolysaccharide synthesis family protein
MSQIFDALQRSESERSGSDLSAFSAATELLQRAERQAVWKWETATQLEKPNTDESSERDESLEIQTVQPATSALETPIAAEPLHLAEPLDVFGQFQSLQVLLPPESRLVCLTHSESPAAEAFRFLGVRLRHLRRDRPLKKVLITSTIPEEGKSTVAANLACTLALGTKQRTLLLEGDVRRPTLSRAFGLGVNPGICEWLQGDRSLMTSVYHLEGPGLWILPAGTAQNNPLELLQSGRLSTIMEQLTERFDWIIIDSPPVLPLADTSVWTRLADGILLVARQGVTEKRQLLRGIEALERKKLIGALLNSSKISTQSNYYDHYRPPILPRADESATK